MKVNEIKNLDSRGLDEKLSELKMELVKINAQIAIGTTPKNPGQVKKIKKTIARIMNVKKQGERGNKEKTGSPNKKSEVVNKHE